MCENCVQRAADIDPRLIKIMDQIEPEFRALASKMQELFKELTPMTIKNIDGEETEIPEELKNEFEKRHAYFARTMGMAAAFGWFSAIDAESTQDIIQHVPPIMQTIQSTLNDGNAYRKVCINGVKH